jgi:hypothetical protein
MSRKNLVKAKAGQGQLVPGENLSTLKIYSKRGKAPISKSRLFP